MVERKKELCVALHGSRVALFKPLAPASPRVPALLSIARRLMTRFSLDCGIIEIESSDEKLTAIANVGFYATWFTLGGSASEGTDLVQTLGDISFSIHCPEDPIDLYAIDSVRALAKRFVCEMESVHGKIGIVSDVRMQKASTLRASLFENFMSMCL